MKKYLQIRRLLCETFHRNATTPLESLQNLPRSVISYKMSRNRCTNISVVFVNYKLFRENSSHSILPAETVPINQHSTYRYLFLINKFRGPMPAMSLYCETFTLLIHSSSQNFTKTHDWTTLGTISRNVRLSVDTNAVIIEENLV